MSISSDNKTIAKAAFEVFGGKPAVTKYWDEKKASSIDILSCGDRPYQGVASYSTIGLSEFSIGYMSENIPLGIEIVGACASKFDCFSNIIASCAFNVINSSFSCYPGAVFQNIIKLYKPDSFMKHVFFTTPFLWNDELKSLNFSNKKVAWLLAVPISDEEFRYSEENGIDALESVFEEKQIDIFDLYRKSVIYVNTDKVSEISK